MFRPGGNKLHVGDNFSLYSEKFQGWLEAEVVDIDKNNGTVQVALVTVGMSGVEIEKQWLDIGSSLISVKHKKWNSGVPIVLFNSRSVKL